MLVCTPLQSEVQQISGLALGQNLSNRNRTSDRWMTNQAVMHYYSPPLYQLSYREQGIPSMRIELTTLGLLDPRSNQLSYEGLHYFSRGGTQIMLN